MRHKKIIFILSWSIFISAQISLNAQVAKTFPFTGSMQVWTVPACVTQVTITAIGAAGGGEAEQYPLENGGNGATIVGYVAVTTGDVIDIYVGGQGSTNYNYDGGAGGGGTFIWDATASKLLEVAGGGGGSFSYNTGGYDASVTTTPTGQNGGAGELGGGANAIDAGGGGAGFLGDGANSGNFEGGLGGSDRANGFAGGAGDIAGGDQAVVGGYGGGGGSGYNDGGGGGGYAGGGSGAEDGGGGGSSYVNGTMLSSATVNTGNGSVSISYITDTVGAVATHIINSINCFGGNGGSASALVTGASPVYTYSWLPTNQTKDTATGLSAGTYTVTVRSLCGNTVSASVTITQPSVLTVSASPLGNISCNGGSNGTASSTVSGGTGPYSYSWLPAGGNAATGSGLSVGTYSVNVTDKHGCTGSAQVTVTQPALLSLSASTIANIPCFGDNNGSASAVANSGTPPYTYAWSPAGGNQATAIGLAPGIYSVVLTDANGCTGSAKTTITQPAAALTTSASVVNNILCYGLKTGNASSTTTGGTVPYTYAWTGGQTNASANSLPAGTYTLDITDAHGCKVSAAATITQPSAITVAKMVTPDDGGCTGSAWVMVNGGVIPYTYAWSNGNTTAYAHDICGQANYCCNVTDANGCAVDSICVTVDNNTGVNNIASASGKVTVYPNPTSGGFQLKITNYESGINNTVEVYNILGEKVYSQFLIPNSSFLINLSNQPNGIYLYRVISNESGNMLGQGKIVLEK